MNLLFGSALSTLREAVDRDHDAWALNQFTTPLHSHTGSALMTSVLRNTVKVKNGKIVRVHKLQAGKSTRTEHAKAAKTAAKWKEKSK